jgi:DNA-directed RNA polymerase I subunit RPA12
VASIPEVITKSQPTRRPVWIAEAEGEDNDESDAAASKHALIAEPCPKCANPEMLFYTLQLRSVDEGSTVFYECPKCQHKFAQNN